MARMSVGAALRAIKSEKGKLAALDARIKMSNLYLSTDLPAFDFAKSVEERTASVAKLLKLRTAVAAKNATTKLENGMLVIEAIRKLDEIKAEIDLVKGLPTQAREERVERETVREYVTTDDGSTKLVGRQVEKKYLCVMPAPKQAARIDELKMSFETINAMLEAKNHDTFID